jgi:hypothetical protein
MLNPWLSKTIPSSGHPADMVSTVFKMSIKCNDFRLTATRLAIWSSEIRYVFKVIDRVRAV